MFREAVDFQEAMDKIIDPNVKSRLYNYQKGIKTRTLHYKETKLKIEHGIEKHNTEKEAKEQAKILFYALATHPKDKGKGGLEGPSIPRVSLMEDTLQKGVEFKKNLERISSQL